jgi:hypothetical protein
MVCFFAVREEVVNVATPLAVVPVPIAVGPSKNVTSSPFATLPKVDVTVAVNVTGCPRCEGDPEVVTCVTDPTGRTLMYSFRIDEVLPAL